MYPSESDNPSFSDPKKYKYYENGRMKYFIYGGKGQDTIPGLRIYNKVGMAIGFLTDVAYIVDFKNNCEFFLSARVFVNEDEVMGDDVYEYEKLGLPFLKKLGETLLEYEKTRKRTIKPNLTPYRFQYQNN